TLRRVDAPPVRAAGVRAAHRGRGAGRDAQPLCRPAETVRPHHPPACRRARLRTERRDLPAVHLREGAARAVRGQPPPPRAARGGEGVLGGAGRGELAPFRGSRGQARPVPAGAVGRPCGALRGGRRGPQRGPARQPLRVRHGARGARPGVPPRPDLGRGEPCGGFGDGQQEGPRLQLGARGAVPQVGGRHQDEVCCQRRACAHGAGRPSGGGQLGGGAGWPLGAPEPRREEGAGDAAAEREAPLPVGVRPVAERDCVGPPAAFGPAAGPSPPRRLRAAEAGGRAPEGGGAEGRQHARDGRAAAGLPAGVPAATHRAAGAAGAAPGLLPGCPRRCRRGRGRRCQRLLRGRPQRFGLGAESRGVPVDSAQAGAQSCGRLPRRRLRPHGRGGKVHGEPVVSVGGRRQQHLYWWFYVSRSFWSFDDEGRCIWVWPRRDIYLLISQGPRSDRGSRQHHRNVGWLLRLDAGFEMRLRDCSHVRARARPRIRSTSGSEEAPQVASAVDSAGAARSSTQHPSAV
ncbi:unnamed protein product, partial [Prorocentrum cordatum]